MCGSLQLSLLYTGECFWELDGLGTFAALLEGLAKFPFGEMILHFTWRVNDLEEKGNGGKWFGQIRLRFGFGFGFGWSGWQGILDFIWEWGFGILGRGLGLDCFLVIPYKCFFVLNLLIGFKLGSEFDFYNIKH